MTLRRCVFTSFVNFRKQTITGRQASSTFLSGCRVPVIGQHADMHGTFLLFRSRLNLSWHYTVTLFIMRVSSLPPQVKPWTQLRLL